MYFFLLCSFLLFEFFHQCPEFYLARISLSEQFTGKAKLSLYFPSAYCGSGVVWKKKVEQQKGFVLLFVFDFRFCDSLSEDDYGGCLSLVGFLSDPLVSLPILFTFCI